MYDPRPRHRPRRHVPHRSRSDLRPTSRTFTFALLALAALPVALTATDAEEAETGAAEAGAAETGSEETGAAETSAAESASALADDAAASVELDDVIVLGRGEDLVGVARSASEGRVGRTEIETRPNLRPGEILEVIPGMMVTQHSGTGKANQYFLRGFNLDHGTDFAASVDGVPVNLPTHGHGQGYLDLNFVMPELVESVDYRKGPYHARVGDFSSAGAVDLRLASRLPRGIVRAGVGTYDWYRLFAADSREVAGGDLLYAAETQLSDGPWVTPEDYQKFNGLLKYTRAADLGGFALTVQGMTSEWTSTDQVPSRAVRSNLVPRLGTIDPSDGGDTSRVTTYGEVWREWDDDSITRLLIHATYYELDLFSNFTYFLDDPTRGDQFQQSDQRLVTGVTLTHDWAIDLADRSIDNTAGLQFRNDWIPEVALRLTDEREVVDTVRDDAVLESSVGLFWEGEVEIVEKLRGTVGARGDVYLFDVSSDDPRNSGSREDVQVSPKAGLVLGPWADTELYGNWGIGFHSNDARGTVIRVDPQSGDPASRVDPLVMSQGSELGVRTQALPGLVSTLAVFYLKLDSELLFVGDAGNTEASRASERVGVEWSNYYQATSWLTLDADVAWTRSRFVEFDPAGDHIPGAFEAVVTGGASVDFPCGFFGSARLRHFGPRPLVEDDSVRSRSTTLVNLRLGYRVTDDIHLHADVLNVLDSEDHDIDYFYTSRLAGEPAGGVDDIHFHPVEPITARLYLTWYFR